MAVSYDLYKDRAITVAGGGSTLAVASGKHFIVGFLDTGTLNVTNGGTVLTYDKCYLGYAGTGEATVSGSGSSWINSDRIFVGEHNGTLNVMDGGNVRSWLCLVGSTSTSTGTVTVDGSGSTLHNDWSLDVGSGGNGTLYITNGGTVTGTQGGVGTYRDSTGMATVDGPGSTWTNSGDLQIAACYGYVGGTCSGTLNITDGGRVTNANGYIGYLSGATGTVTVSGPGSTWTNNGFLYVGEAGGGTLEVSDGALVSVAGDLIVDDDGLSSDGYVNMATGGKLAILGQADSSLSDYLALIQGTDAIRYWDDSVSDWADITTATYGEDYMLSYVTSGHLTGFTVLTVGVVPEPGTFPLAVLAMLILAVFGGRRRR